MNAVGSAPRGGERGPGLLWLGGVQSRFCRSCFPSGEVAPERGPLAALSVSFISTKDGGLVSRAGAGRGSRALHGGPRRSATPGSWPGNALPALLSDFCCAQGTGRWEGVGGGFRSHTPSVSETCSVPPGKRLQCSHEVCLHGEVACLWEPVPAPVLDRCGSTPRPRRFPGRHQAGLLVSPHPIFRGAQWWCL